MSTINNDLFNCLNQLNNIQDTIELRRLLSDTINILDKLKNSESFVNEATVAKKMLLNRCQKLTPKQIFICGQYSEKIQVMIEIAKERKRNFAIKSILTSSADARKMLQYLWRHKCSELQVVKRTLGLRDDQFNKLFVELFDLALLRKDFGVDCEWLELSAYGYEYMRKHYVEKEGFNLW